MNKYKELIIYQIENGWIIKYVPPDNPAIANNLDCISTYCKNIVDLIKKIQELCK